MLGKFRRQSRRSEPLESSEFRESFTLLEPKYQICPRKRMELEYLKRIKTLATIVETQIPYLDEWSASEEEHSSSLSGTTQALVNSLVRLPVGGNVQADTKEVGEALTSAMKVMEMIYVHVQKFLPKASEIDSLSSELARSVAGERVLIDECGDLLLKTYTSQVEDCSLRGHLMQFKKSNSVMHQCTARKLWMIPSKSCRNNCRNVSLLLNNQIYRRNYFVVKDVIPSKNL